MAKLSNEKILSELILKSWNADPLISTKMVDGDDLHKRHTLNMLWTMLPDDVAEDWIDYYRRKLGVLADID
jgi:hypothetical protein